MKPNQVLTVAFLTVLFGMFAQNASAFHNTEVGRFISRDSIEYDAEDTNVYRYVGNDSIDYVDSDGFVRHTAADPNQPGVKEQGREAKEKKRQSSNWKPNNNTKPKQPPKHTPGRGHQRFSAKGVGGAVGLWLLMENMADASSEISTNWRNPNYYDKPSDCRECVCARHLQR
jgi:hypothetical protein